MARAIKPLDARFGKGAEGLEARWTEVVGKALANRTEPGRMIKSRLKQGAVLELRVDGPSAILIQHQAADIIARVNLFLGEGAVSGLRIVQGPLRGQASRRTGSAAIVTRRSKAPLDAAAEQRLAADLAAFADGPLKQALSRLGREVLRGERRP